MARYKPRIKEFAAKELEAKSNKTGLDARNAKAPARCWSMVSKLPKGAETRFTGRINKVTLEVKPVK